MIDPRRAQRSFGDKLIAEEVKDLHEDWMISAEGPPCIPPPPSVWDLSPTSTPLRIPRADPSP
jgi:hypothetical protein